MLTIYTIYSNKNQIKSRIIFFIVFDFSVIYMWIVAFVLRDSINDIIAKFQRIYDLSN